MNIIGLRKNSGKFNIAIYGNLPWFLISNRQIHYQGAIFHSYLKLQGSQCCLVCLQINSGWRWRFTYVYLLSPVMTGPCCTSNPQKKKGSGYFRARKNIWYAQQCWQYLVALLVWTDVGEWRKPNVCWLCVVPTSYSRTLVCWQSLCLLASHPNVHE
jgi:hypothetical protein